MSYPAKQDSCCFGCVFGEREHADWCPVEGFWKGIRAVIENMPPMLNFHATYGETAEYRKNYEQIWPTREKSS